MKVLLVNASFAPKNGGPAYSLMRLATALADRGVDVAVWAADQSTGSALLHKSVKGLNGSVSHAMSDFGRPDVVHDNGIWLPHNHRLAMFAVEHNIPRIVSTRGMLEPWARSHKRFKKTIAWWLFQKHDLQKAALLHATATQEARHLQLLGFELPVCVIPDGTDLPEARNQGTNQTMQGTNQIMKDTSFRTALFVGRIYPVKGLLMLIEAWARVRPQGWCLQIAGPDEAGHRAEVERAVSRAGLADSVSFLGPVEGDAKSLAYGNANLFVLPSHSESFGMVVAEALAHGVPVLTTRGTPWGQLAERECGWWVDATVDGLTRGLQAATAEPGSVLRVMGLRGRDWMAADFGWDAIACRFVDVYEQVVRNTTGRLA